MEEKMEGQKVYGYMRVSSKEQNEDRQRIALLEGYPILTISWRYTVSGERKSLR